MLSYESTGKVGLSAARVILREAQGLERTWWRGGLGFEPDEVERPVELRGETLLFGRAGAADAVFILNALEKWSARLKVTWRIRMNGDDWGTIDSGGRSKLLVSSIDKWAGRAKTGWSAKGTWQFDEKRRTEIAARYPANG